MQRKLVAAVVAVAVLLGLGLFLRTIDLISLLKAMHGN